MQPVEFADFLDPRQRHLLSQRRQLHLQPLRRRRHLGPGTVNREPVKIMIAKSQDKLKRMG